MRPLEHLQGHAADQELLHDARGMLADNDELCDDLPRAINDDRGRVARPRASAHKTRRSPSQREVQKGTCSVRTGDDQVEFRCSLGEFASNVSGQEARLEAQALALRFPGE